MKRIMQKSLTFFTEKNIVILIGVLAFCFYLIFNLVIPYDYFDHDYGELGLHHGHTGYMWHIWENWSLPVFSIDPTTEESFYNPPLHYVLGALWVRVGLFFNDSLRFGFECLQF